MTWSAVLVGSAEIPAAMAFWSGETSGFGAWCFLMYSSSSGRNLASTFLIGQAAPSARPQMVVPGVRPMLSAIWPRTSRSSSRPPPALIRLKVLYIQVVPSRQGVHWPQLSWAKNRDVL